MTCLVDGLAVDVLPVTDSSVLRGDGCFEAVRSYGGRLFRLDEHLDRLERSAAALDLEVPDRRLLVGWAQTVAGSDDCVVRIVVTRGPAVPGEAGAGRCIVMSHPLPPPLPTVRLLPVAAPWHPAGREWELAGVKSVSYAANLAASRRARASGFDDALLVSDDGTVLEGPTFSVGWVKEARVFTPAIDLGILASITRALVLELAEVEEVRANLGVLERADEVFVMSTVKEVTPVVAVADRSFPVGSVTESIAQRVRRAVEVTPAAQDSSAQPR